MPARGAQSAKEGDLGCRLVEMEGLRIELPRESDDLVLAEGVGAEVGRFADLAILVESIGAGTAVPDGLRVPKAHERLALTLSVGVGLGSGARMAPARELVGGPVGHDLARFPHEFDAHLADADVGAGRQVALGFDKVV